jgi:BirA family biotin operon repressor/biotin-[acetyl-CoA-carboxylase] ligase
MSPPSVAEPAAAVPGPALRAALAAPLRPGALAAAARGRIAAPAIEAVLETGSTNADLLAQARAHAPAGPRLRACLNQTAGRGRMGRRWYAAPGSALLFSLAVPLGNAAPPAAATLVAAVVLADLLDAAFGRTQVASPDAAASAARLDLQLKWPNDLLLDGRKLGGVLAELAVDRAGVRTLVLGVGLNLWLDAAARGSIGQPAAALAERVPLATLPARREELIGGAAAALVEAVHDCTGRGFVPYQPRFMQRFALLGDEVDLIEQGARSAGGRALGIDGEGRLLLEREGRVVAIASGEVSVRERTAHAVAPRAIADAGDAARAAPARAAMGGVPSPAAGVRE